MATQEQSESSGHQAATLRPIVELGSGVSMQAEVPDASRLFVKIGLGFHLESSWDETLDICSSRREALRASMAESTQRIDEIRAHIAIVQQGLTTLAELPA